MSQREPDGSRGGELLPRTILRFCEVLRRGGISVSTSSVMDALNAMVFVDIFSDVEYSAMNRQARLILILALFVAFALRAWLRTREFAAAPENRLQFEPTHPA